MCGRTACALSKDKVIEACTCQNRKAGDSKSLHWLDLNQTANYQPSYNIGPGSNTPVLLSGIHCKQLKEDVSVLSPMRWGLVPSWHRGEPKEFGFKTINCRIEGIREKPTFKRPLQQGKRCVVLAEGFFEWKEEKDKKQPYFVYFPQEKEINMATRKWESQDDSPNPRLLTMAGLFDRITLQDGEEFFSYTIITKESCPTFSWLHTRMPAILDGEENVFKWIDSQNVSLDNALELLKHPVDLEWHSVSSIVGNVRNNGIECVLPCKTPSTKTSTRCITNWFKPKMTKDTENGPSPSKILKKE